MSISIIRTVLGDVEARLAGMGKPILFVHGGHVDCSETIFQKGLDPQKFLFIAPSRPGYGNTPLSNLNKSPKGTADLFIELLNELKIPKVIVIGISAGGLTALEIAANYPDRIENLVMMSALTKNWFNKKDKVYRGAKIVFSPNVERFTWFLYRVFFNISPVTMGRVMFKELSTYKPVEFSQEELSELREMTFKMRSRHGFSNDLDQTIDQQTLLKIGCPTVVLHSEYDTSVDISHAENGSQRIKNCKLITFKNRWGHLLWLGPDYNTVLDDIYQQWLLS